METVSGSSILNLFPDDKKTTRLAIKLEAVSNFRNLGGMPIEGSSGNLVIRPHVINRSASPTNATVSDEFWLLHVLSIKTLIDLRTTWENKTISPVRKFEDNFVQFSIKEDKEKEGRGSPATSPTAERRSPSPSREQMLSASFDPNRSSRVNGQQQQQQQQQQPRRFSSGQIDTKHDTTSEATGNGASGLVVSTGSNSSSGSSSSSSSSNGDAVPTIQVPTERELFELEMEEQRNGFLWRIYNRNEDMERLRSHSPGVYRNRYCIPLINNQFFLEGVYQTASNETKVKVTVSRYLLFNDKVGAFMLMNHLNELGILGMYRLTLLYTQEELLTILRIMKNKDNYPIMYFCSLGKDRTGMVTAILLSCLGVPRDIIVADYAKSEGNLTAHLEQIKKYFNRVGLAKDEFVRSPPEIMDGLLSWLVETFGSIANYLEVIGFKKEEQEQLRNNLIVTKEEYNQLVSLSHLTNLTDLQKRHDDYVSSQSNRRTSANPFKDSRLWRRQNKEERGAANLFYPRDKIRTYGSSKLQDNGTVVGDKFILQKIDGILE
ncbi:hypothetical protein SAMD00019534_021460 [Acytostelium subglobosum LB1]|uniref:hypothetical protein n=1 Tax=Acytostelium subglobosum LB1 TaxID=1410327 RepID=UPI00064511B5|nr:hypothetical protein SAMD00019534_021460 [Acytostelium subglobosum LB1]GAM18971.1 hypothetical protein SAMD00019534_021460 [Acytostelium subglobosum LB1]|eukprot:XP_012758191.1 hypothetical protein SAMD00019534_021460 [Acytostelium subglobosum LB1]